MYHFIIRVCDTSFVTMSRLSFHMLTGRSGARRAVRGGAVVRCAKCRQAEDMVRYLNDYQRLLGLRVRYNTAVRDVRRHADTGHFSMSDQHGHSFSCKRVIMATGMWKPNNPSFRGSEYAHSYQNVSTDPKDFEGKKVLILGRGNSAFETANRIYGSTSLVHMVGRSRARLAWSTHYVGDLRALNNNLLDTYQLKSLDGLLEANVESLELEKHAGKLWVRLHDADDPTDVATSFSDGGDNFSLREGYDAVIACLGFKFDTSIFHSSTQPDMSRRVPKYPAIKATYESQNIPGLYFAGTATHSLDFRRSAGGFIHGFRYTVRALHRQLEWRYHRKPWPSSRYPVSQLLNVLVMRVNEAAGPYQMFGLLADLFLFHKNNTEFSLIPEFPVALMARLSEVSGHEAEDVPLLVGLLEYGPDFSGPGKDTFRPDRATGDPLEAHRSNFLHPVFYFYPRLPTESEMMHEDRSTMLLPRPTRVHHVLEDFLTQWTAPQTHVLPLRRFLESCVGTDLRDFHTDSCFVAELSSRNVPQGCMQYGSHHGWGVPKSALA